MSPTAYERLKTGALLFNRPMGLIEVSGPDRVTWLQGMVTNDLEGLSSGQGCYAAHLDPRGKVLAQMCVLVQEDRVWLELERGNVGATVEALNKLLIMEDAETLDRSADLAVMTIVGVQSRSILERWAGSAIDLPSPYSHSLVGRARVLRGDLGYDLIVGHREVERVCEELVALGSERGDTDLWECIRIEEGLPIFGIDVDSTTTLPELGDKGIDYKKGCYIGQEVVAKIHYIGHVNRCFVGLKFDGDAVPIPNATVLNGGRDVGRITSAVFSPGLGTPIALAYVRLGSEKAGTQLAVSIDGNVHGARVADLPFVAHQY